MARQIPSMPKSLSLNDSSRKMPDCLAAVSGGPDSMALLAWMLAQGLHPAVCHVNYHHRPTASRDERIVRNFCSSHGLSLLILHPGRPSGNFQDWARQVRYTFFESAAAAYHLDRLYLGHQQDDALETWLMQKQRNGENQILGLEERTQRNGLTLIRPLLSYSKAELEAWCRNQNIAYGIDESNLEDAYLRNCIRHRVLEPLAPQERKQLLAAYQSEKKAHAARRRRIAALAAASEAALLEDALALPVLDQMLSEKIGRHYGRAQLAELCQKLKKGQMVVLDGWKMQKTGQKITMRPDKAPICFYIDSQDQLAALCQAGYILPGFGLRLARNGKPAEQASVSPDEFPLLVRGPKAGDEIVMRYGTKKVHRFFIDRHIEKIYRKEWPLLCSKSGEILFVNRLGANASHFSGRMQFCMLELSLS